MSDLTKEQVIDYLSNMPVIEIAQLVKELEAKWGVSASAPVALPGLGALPGAPPAEEQTEFDIVIEAVPENRIGIIKIVRALTNLGLKEAKEKVDSVASGPQTLLEAQPKEAAESAKKQLEEAGAKVSLK
jgi:large subunit ribosomal protein L7/L12